MVGQGRIAFTFGHPFEGDLEDLVIRRVSALEDDRGNLTTVEVTLLGVLNLHLANEGKLRFLVAPVRDEPLLFSSS